MSPSKKILFLVNDLNFFLSHRLDIAVAARNEGFEIIVATPESDTVSILENFNFKHEVVPFSRSGQNPIWELITLWYIAKLFLKIKPQLIHLVTIKPVIYGAILARILGVKAVVVAVSGLGTVFVSKSILSNIRLSLVKFLYSVAFKHKNLIAIFQNEDDQNTLIEQCKLKRLKFELIPGSGVDLNHYKVGPEPEGEVVVVMAARLLADKGVYEFVEAARVCKRKNVAAQFRLVGSIDFGNQTSLTQKDLELIEREGIVKVLGYRSDISNQYSDSHIVCLPSYREGLPKALIEAAACARAVITTDVPGCRDAIIPGETGLLVPVKDSESLALAIEELVNDSEKRKNMGLAGRNLAERKFTIEKVVLHHLKIYKNLLAKCL